MKDLWGGKLKFPCVGWPRSIVTLIKKTVKIILNIKIILVAFLFEPSIAIL